MVLVPCWPRVAFCLARSHQDARMRQVNGADSPTTNGHTHEVAIEQRVPRLLALCCVQQASDFAPQARGSQT